MNDMSEDTIEVLLFEDLDTIHRQVPESSETPTDQ